MVNAKTALVGLSVTAVVLSSAVFTATPAAAGPVAPPGPVPAVSTAQPAVSSPAKAQAPGQAQAQNPSLTQVQHQNAAISAYWSWPSTNFWNVDQHVRIDEKARATFWAQQVWWAGTSTAAYVGLQTHGNRFNGTVGDMAIFSAWNATAARGTSCARFTETGGSGYSCRLAYPLKTGRLYRLRIWKQEADASGQWWGAWVKDETTGVEQGIGGVRLPLTYRFISTNANFVEYFGAKVGCAEVPRSTAVFTQPAANHRGGGVYDFVGTYSSSTTGACVTGSAAVVTLPGTKGVRIVHGGRISTNTRVVFVHGFERGGSNGCDGTWGDMLTALRTTGWTNTFVPSLYYADDTTCSATNREPLANVRISDYGSHDVFHPSGHVTRDGVIVGHSTDARIGHLAYHWAWMVYERYTRDLHPIKAVGHSMGGLIIRSALKEVQAGNPDFPPRLVVEDVVTLGTPHSGAGFANACALTHEQCRDLRPDSDFLNDLSDNGQNPQGDGGTEWTAVGAHDDDSVTAGSATNMTAAEEIQYASGQGIEHGQYMHLKLGADLLDADAEADITHHGNQCEQFATSFWPVTTTHLGLGNLVDDDC
jgi:hypothetical protein